MTACDLQPDDERFHGHLNGRDLLELLKMLHRTCSSGVLHLDAGPNRASLCIDQGAIRAAFFNQLAGSPALARIILIGETDFRFELGTAHTVASFAVNIAKDTALILATVERMLDDHGGRTAREPAAAPCNWLLRPLSPIRMANASPCRWIRLSRRPHPGYCPRRLIHKL